MGAKKIGFDITDATVPAREIMRGGPGRDGIFALTNPEFVSAAEANKDRRYPSSGGFL
jgi:hypothetical protein